MNRIPFDPYDFFGYLASGLLILVGMDVILGFPHVLGQDLKVVEGAVLLMAIYVTGQIIATPAKAILEDGLIDKILGRPNVNLFREKKPCLRGLIFPGYYAPLPEQTRKKILGKAENEGIMGTGEDLFLHARYNPTILQDQKLMEKLNSFLNKYGFNRNLSFSALIVGIAFLVKIKFSSQPGTELLKYSVTALAAAVLLLYRYLKFFRQYSYELFNTYARSK
jgi:hypothetical protein